LHPFPIHSPKQTSPLGVRNQSHPFPIPSRKQWIFQDDGATPHRSKETREWLSARYLNVSDKETFNWPANSPDLNPIEHMWPLLKGQLDLTEVTDEDQIV
jgi:hypothetical protein